MTMREKLIEVAERKMSRAEDATYSGSAPDRGELAPHNFEGEGFAVLQCGGTSVRLSYSALSLMSGWLSLGASGYGYPGISGDIIDAFNSITCEAAIGNTHDLDHIRSGK